MTPDGLPLAGPVPGRQHPGVWVLAGFNGHGIMHGPAAADALVADMVGLTPEIDLAPLAPRRFTTGVPLRRTPSLL